MTPNPLPQTLPQTDGFAAAQQQLRWASLAAAQPDLNHQRDGSNHVLDRAFAEASAMLETPIACQLNNP